MSDAIAMQLATLVAQTPADGYSATTLHKAKIHLLDTLGVLIAGSRASETTMLRDALAIPDHHPGVARIVGSAARTDTRTAALINGVAAHAYELDDSGGCDHSGAVVVPALLALSDALPTAVSGTWWLHAMIQGYEVGRRVLEACGGYEAHNGVGWHSTGTCGAFGAAAGAAVLGTSTALQIAHALGIACSQASGTWGFIHDGSHTKKLHAGRAAEAGVVAAQLARHGMCGPLAIFTPRQWGNFFDTYGVQSPDPSALTTEWGVFWRINRCSIKPYATCRGSHSGIDALTHIMRTQRIVAADIARIDIDISAFQYGMCGSTSIQTRAEAQMSLPYALAAQLCYGKVFLAELEESAWAAPAIASWLARMQVHIDHQQADADEPIIHVTTHAGVRHSLRVPDPLGGPQNPLSDAQVLAKFHDLAAPVLGDTACHAIADMVLTFDTCADARQLGTLLM